MKNPDRLRLTPAAEALADVVYDFTAAFPRDERFGLTSQIRRAAVSVGANLFEGCAQRSSRALLPFLYHAHGSVAELRFQTRLAGRRGYGEAALGQRVLRAIAHVQRMLLRLIAYHEGQR